jgi:N-acetylmuramoyl-L-alanine amidase
MPSGRKAAGALLIVALLALPSAQWASGRTATVEFPGERRTDTVELLDVDGVTYFRLSDLTRVVGAVRHWNPQTQKLALGVGRRRITLAPDNQFVLLDQVVRNIGRPILLRDGAFWVPQSFLVSALATGANLTITWDSERAVVTVETRGAAVMAAEIYQRPEGTVVVFPLSGPVEFDVKSARGGSAQLLLKEASLADTLELLEGAGLVSAVNAEEGDDGVRVSVDVTDARASYTATLYHDPTRIELLVESGRDAGFPEPELKASKQLEPRYGEIFDRAGREIETVMIDPGHGGRDLGAVGPSGVLEKDVTLAISEELARYLQDQGFYVFMTRSYDSLVSIKRRAEIANLAVADVFVSIQCGSWHSRAASGFHVLYYEPRRAPAPPVTRSLRGGVSYQGRQPVGASADALLWDGVQSEHLGESIALARHVSARMGAALSLANRGVTGDNLAVLGGCSMPAVLVEAAFITNRTEEGLLSDESFRRDVARAIGRGIVEYANDVKEGNR